MYTHSLSLSHTHTHTQHINTCCQNPIFFCSQLLQLWISSQRVMTQHINTCCQNPIFFCSQLLQFWISSQRVMTRGFRVKESRVQLWISSQRVMTLEGCGCGFRGSTSSRRMLLTIIAAMIGSSSADLPNCNTVGSCANVSDVIFGLNAICIEMLEDNSDCWKCIFSHLPPRMLVTSLEVSLCG